MTGLKLFPLVGKGIPKKSQTDIPPDSPERKLLVTLTDPKGTYKIAPKKINHGYQFSIGKWKTKKKSDRVYRLAEVLAFIEKDGWDKYRDILKEAGIVDLASDKCLKKDPKPKVSGTDEKQQNLTHRQQVALCQSRQPDLKDKKLAALIDPNSSLVHSRLGQKFLNLEKRDYMGAKKEIGLAIKLDGKNIEAHFVKIKLLVLYRKYEAAEKLADKLNSLFPNEPRIYTKLGDALAGRREGTRAENAYKKAMELHPKNADTFFKYADAQFGRGKFQEAGALHRKAIELRPEFIAARVNLGLALWHQGELKGAVNELKLAIRSKGDDEKSRAYAHMNLGVFHRYQGNLDKAETELNKAMKIFSTDNLQMSKTDLDRILAITKSNLAAVFLEKGEYDSAIVQFREAISLRKKIQTAHSGIGEALVKKGQHDEAIKEFEEEVVINQNFYDRSYCYKRIGDIFFMKGDLTRAVSKYTQALSHHGSNKDAMHALRKALRAQQAKKESTK